MASTKKKAKPRWAVCIDRKHSFICGADKKIAWTRDRAEADRMAERFEARVVDIDEWAKRPRFLNQVECYQVFGAVAVELGLSRNGDPITGVRVKKTSFNSGLNRKGTRVRPATITLVIELEGAQ